MQLIRPDIRSRQAFGRGSKGSLDVALVEEHARARWVVHERRRNIAESGSLRRLAPFHFQRAHRRLGLLLALRDDPHEIAHRDGRDHSGQMRDRRLVHTDERPPDMVSRIEAGVGRADDPTVQHAGHTHVVDEHEAAGRLGGQVHAGRRGADNPVLRNRLDGDIVRERKPDAVGPDQLAIGYAAIVLRAGPDDAVLHDELRGRNAKNLGRPRRQKLAGLGCRAPQRDRAELDRLARDRRPLIGRDCGVAQHQGNSLEGDVQFLRDDLRERRPNAGAEIDMPAEDRHLARRRDKDEGRETSPRARSPERPPLPSPPRRRACPASPDNLRGGVPAAEARSCAGEGRCEPHGGDNLDVGAAAAEVEAQRLADVRVGRIRVCVDKSPRGHDHSVEAIAALGRGAGDESLLHGVEPSVDGQALERRDGSPFDIREREHASARKLAVDKDAAGAALPEAATVFRPVQREVIAQERKQGRGSRQTCRDRLAVHQDPQGRS